MMYRTGILIMSDKGAAGEREDRSGEQILQILGPDYSLEYYQIIPDEKHIFVEQMKYACDQLGLDLLLTSGGTGFSRRDITPEASLEVIEKLVPGIPEAMRAYGMQHTSKAMLSRAVAGIRKNTLIVSKIHPLSSSYLVHHTFIITAPTRIHLMARSLVGDGF
jgi:molybdopterin adenylyltransferase